jgi:hypothetical protein
MFPADKVSAERGTLPARSRDNVIEPAPQQAGSMRAGGGAGTKMTAEQALPRDCAAAAG